MLPSADDTISRDGRSIILAYDHGLEHGPVDFEPNPATADPERLFELATHSAVTSLAVQKGIAEAYYPDYEDEVNLVVKLNGTSNLWRGEPNSAVNCSAEYAAELGADAIGFTVYGGSSSARPKKARANTTWASSCGRTPAVRGFETPTIRTSSRTAPGWDSNSAPTS